MSNVRGFGLNGRAYYTNVTYPQDVSLQFTVTPTNGLGITSLKSNGYVENVFMHTSTTPSVNNGFTNPNPANGYAVIQFKNPFNYFLNSYSTFMAPSATATKIDNSALTAGNVYVISTVGDASAATWSAIGVPNGITPAVGVSFVALTVGAGSNTSTSRVMSPTTSGIYGVEVIGLPNATIAPSNVARNAGAQILVQFMAPTFTAGAYTPAGTVAAPVFTGSALANHTHALTLKNAAVADGATTRVNAGTNLLGANTGSDITVAGAGANGGIANSSAGTPAGTNSAPAFTGSAASLTGTLALGATAPATGTIVCMKFSYDRGSVTIDGL